jgi:hypothetical protein
MADISFLAVKTFVEVSKIWKNGKRVLYMVLNVLSNEKVKNLLPFPGKGHVCQITRMSMNFSS